MITIHRSGDRYTLKRHDGLWWQGVQWMQDPRFAIGLHGEEVLQRELETYFAGAVRDYAESEPLPVGQLTLLEI